MSTTAIPSGTNWQKEALHYDRFHPRMQAMVRLMNAGRERRLLDVGCSAATLQRLLPADFEYFGCDITDHAASRLGPTHFQQLDLNATHDLSFFENRGIQLIHMGGFLEYMGQPRELLRSFHRVVGVGGRLIMSMTNFECHRYQDVAKSHHRAWRFKPKLQELRETLASQGWCVEREVPFIGPSGRWRTRLYRLLAYARGVDHPWTRQHAWLFITIARAIER
jgi:ubiquinone/menaquinone biosynthesis C-methylase UbiE